jgi:hypothetical protein
MLHERLTTSIYKTITVQTIHDLEEALWLSKELSESPKQRKDEVATFLAQRLQTKQRATGTPLPGLLRAR